METQAQDYEVVAGTTAPSGINLADLRTIPIIAKMYPFKDDEKYQALKEDIRLNGLIIPIIVRECAGALEIVDGERRRQACIELGILTLPAEKIQIMRFNNELEAVMCAVRIQNQRKRQKPYERVQSAVVFLEEYKEIGSVLMKKGKASGQNPKGWDTYEELASQFGVGSKTIKRFRRIQGLKNQEIIDQIISGEKKLGPTYKVYFPTKPRKSEKGQGETKAGQPENKNLAGKGEPREGIEWHEADQQTVAKKSVPAKNESLLALYEHTFVSKPADDKSPATEVKTRFVICKNQKELREHMSRNGWGGTIIVIDLVSNDYDKYFVALDRDVETSPSLRVQEEDIVKAVMGLLDGQK